MESMMKGCFYLCMPLLAIQVAWADAAERLPMFNGAEIATLEELASARGREGIDMDVFNNMNLDALLSGNTANNNVTGVNIIDNSSFAGATGIFSVIQNSGNNVIIQDSTIVNVTIIP